MGTLGKVKIHWLQCKVVGNNHHLSNFCQLNIFLFKKMPSERIELPASGLQDQRSATELWRRIHNLATIRYYSNILLLQHAWITRLAEVFLAMQQVLQGCLVLSQMCNFLSGNFLNVHFSKWQFPKWQLSMKKKRHFPNEGSIKCKMNRIFF